ncbi:MAG: hypothetical protein KY464_14630, partial [Gemmatimonadetes bacterium]|nr:hypothetical protein [Gemmatimonadota bacterium]
MPNEPLQANGLEASAPDTAAGRRAAAWTRATVRAGQILVGGDGLLLEGQTLYAMRNSAKTLVTLRLAPTSPRGASSPRRATRTSISPPPSRGRATASWS